jgi:predicted RNA-binding Zn ribbon-like protein
MAEGNETLLPTAGADPGSRAPAPGSLRLVQALVNTLNAETGQDLLGTVPAATAWLGTAGLLPSGSVLTGLQQAALLELREATRQVLSDHTHRRDDPAAAGRLTMALAPCRLTLAVEAAGGVRLVSADHDPFSRVIGGIAAAIAEAAMAGTWARLKCCPGRRCGWAFYDRSASSRSRWCSMQICGARAKMRAYRDRQAG